MKKSKFRRSLNRGIFVVAVLGMMLSVYLWTVQYQIDSVGDIIVPCTPDGGCNKVLGSDISKFLGVPIAVFGLFYYSGVALLAFQREFIEDRLLDRLMFVFVIAGIAVTVYLRYLEFVEIGHVCAWCWVSVLFVLLLTVFYLLGYEYDRGNKKVLDLAKMIGD